MVLEIRDKECQLITQTKKESDANLVHRDEGRNTIRVRLDTFVGNNTYSKLQLSVDLKFGTEQCNVKLLATLQYST